MEDTNQGCDYWEFINSVESWDIRGRYPVYDDQGGE